MDVRFVMKKNSFTNCVLLFLALGFLFSACSSETHEEPCVDYLAVMKSGSDKWTLVNTNGQELLADKIEGCEVSPAVGGIFSVKDSNGMWHFYTATVEMRQIGKEYLETGAFTGRLAPVVCTEGWIQYIDKGGNVAFDSKMAARLGVTEAYNFHPGFARFRSAHG